MCIFNIFLHKCDAAIKIKELTLMYYCHLIFRPLSGFVSCADNSFIAKVQSHMFRLDVTSFSIHSVWITSSDFPKLSRLSLLKFFFNVYLFLRQRQSMNGRGAEREGDTESEAGSKPRAVSAEPNAGLELVNREIVT